MKLEYSGIDPKELEEARQKRMQHKMMISTIHDIITYLFYIVLLTTAANTSKDIQAYRFHQSISNVFLKQGDPLFEQVLF